MTPAVTGTAWKSYAPLDSNSLFKNKIYFSIKVVEVVVVVSDMHEIERMSQAPPRRVGRSLTALLIRRRWTRRLPSLVFNWCLHPSFTLYRVSPKIIYIKCGSLEKNTKRFQTTKFENIRRDKIEKFCICMTYMEYIIHNNPAPPPPLDILMISHMARSNFDVSSI